MQQIVGRAKALNAPTPSARVGITRMPDMRLYEKHGFIKTAQDSTALTLTLSVK